MKNFILLFCLVVCAPITINAQTTFEPKQTIDPDTGADPNAIATGLIDGDAFADIIVATHYDHTLVWYKNNGDGTFARQPNIAHSLTIMPEVFLVDLNNDTFMDVVAGNMWFANDGTGNFGPEQAIANSASVYAVGDIDADSTMDVVVVSGYIVFWYANDGAGTFGSANTIGPLSTDAGTFELTDIDTDGDLDLITSTITLANANEIRIFRNQLVPSGTASFVEDATPVIANSYSIITDIAVADMDGDANLDILATESYAKLYWYEYNGSGYTRTDVPTSLESPLQIIFEDLDNDNLKDIVLGGAGGANNIAMAWRKNNGNGTFAADAVIDDTQINVNGMAIADFENDGDMDIASVSFNENDLNWFKNLLDPLAVADFEANPIAIYPNPTNGNFTIDLDKEYTDVTIQIYNMLGQIVSSEKYASAKTLEQQINAFRGVYFVNVAAGGQNFTLKIIKN